MQHITVRMAWHDRGWDGRICENPTANSYCSGTYSLLSHRLAREKRAEIEAQHPCEPLDNLGKDYLPPCYWTSCAFAEQSTKVVHRHPFLGLSDKKQIEADLPPHSVYTWPFRLAMTHSDSVKRRHGKYFPDLEERVDHYCADIIPNKSLIFFYLNYDNPVSADDYRYALVGCARVANFGLTGQYQFDSSELEHYQKREGMQNFKSLNWALRLTHEGHQTSVRLPYQEYLQYVEKHPEDLAKLQDMRVLIEEPMLLPSFKYVSEQVNDDQCLALLYKLRRAFMLVDQQGICNPGNAIETIDGYISQIWKGRGLYPGLGSVIGVLADLAEGEPQKESLLGLQVVDALKAGLAENDDLMTVTFEVLQSRGSVPRHLRNYAAIVRDARAGLRDNLTLLPALRKLSLFSLTPRQVARVLFPDSNDGLHPFGGRSITCAEIAENPYLLCETYVAATDLENEYDADLDRERRTDGPIDYLTIDIGMFPDSKHLKRNEDIQGLTVAGPERLRAFAIEALRRNELLGDSYAPLNVLVEAAMAHPLFYRDSIALRPDQFLSDEHLAHFRHRFYIHEVKGEHFFYLKETKDAESIVNRYVNHLLATQDHRVDLAWVDADLDKQAAERSKKIENFDANGFKKERRQLIEGVLQRQFFVVTGRPGSGKTKAVCDLVDRLERAGETTTVLTPTGKAALRLSAEAEEEEETKRKWKAETIMHWVYHSGLAKYLDGHAPMRRSDKYVATDNLVIDEMSMVSLPQLAFLFRALEVHQPGSVKRIILVGDENQLPPIGCGRPFYEIAQYLREDAKREQRNIVRLKTNCRQQHDPVVLEAAHLFAGKNRYHNELYERLLVGGQISPYLRVAYWENTEELQNLIQNYLADLVKDTLLEVERSIGKSPEDAVSEFEKLSADQAFNRLIGLYDNGNVPNFEASKLRLDRGQLLSPYRGGPSGTLALGELVRSIYRRKTWSDNKNRDSAFGHSDKIIRICNRYGWNREEQRAELLLSNGSIGVICINHGIRQLFFPEKRWPFPWRHMHEEDFELAYAITVHKAQGSDFNEVLVIIPERRALLSRELLYTALTRSKTKLTLLVQKTPRENPLQIARDRSVILFRNSSTFTDPLDSRRIFEPERGVKVRSKIEYLIYRSLREARDAHQLSFEYEPPLRLTLDGRAIEVHPDFAVHLGGKTFYWEHLGMLDRQDYSHLWRSRRAGYEREGLSEALVTTDDLNGVREARIQQVIEDLKGGRLGGTESESSRHHYSL